MAEIKVKLIAEAQELLRGADDAAAQIARKTPVIKVQADTSDFTDVIRRAVEEAEKLRPVIRVTGAGAPPATPPAPGGSEQGEGRAGTPNNRDSALLDFLKVSQTQEARNSEALKRAIDELTRIISATGRRGGGSGSGPGPGGGGGNDESGGLSWKNALLQYMNIRPTGENGQIRVQDIIGNPLSGQGGLMGLLGAIPGAGMLAGLATGLGAIQKIGQQIEKDAERNKTDRDRASGILADTYDVFGSVEAYSPAEYGEEGYSSGAYISMKTGQQLGYDLDTTLSASDTLISGSGFTDTQTFQNDITSVLETSRATGVDVNTMASFAAKATNLGYQDRGEQAKAMNLLGREIEASGSQGREDMVVDVLEKIFDELASVNVTVSEQAVGEKLNLMNALSANTGMSLDRAQDAVGSIEDWATSNDTSVLVAAGLGTKFTGQEGYLELRRMQEKDPTAFSELVMQNLASRGYDKTSILYMLDQNGVGSVSTNEAVLDAMLGNRSVSADMTDQAANDAYGEAYTQRRNAQYEQTVAPYARYQITEDMGGVANGLYELPRYKDAYRQLNEGSAQDMQSEDWWKNHLSQAQYDLGKYDLRDGGRAQMKSIEDAWRNAQTGVSLSRTQGSPAAGLQLPASPDSADLSGYSQAIAETVSTMPVTDDARQELARTRLPSTEMESARAGTYAGMSGKDAYQELRNRQQADPAAFAQTVMHGLAGRGYDKNSILHMLDQNGVGSMGTNEAAVDAAQSSAGMQPYQFASGGRPGRTGRLTNREEAQEEARAADHADFGTAPRFANPFSPTFADAWKSNQAYMMNKLSASPFAVAAQASPIASLMHFFQGQRLGWPEQAERALPADPEAPAQDSDSGDSYYDALTRNTEELKKNTQALLGGGDQATSYVTGSQQQSSLTTNGQMDALSNSVSIESPMSRFQQEHPFLYNLASGVGAAAAGVGNFISGIGEAFSDGFSQLTGGDAGSNETQTVSSADGTSTVTSPDGTTTTKSANGTTTKHRNGTLQMSGSFETATPHAVGNDYVPYDGYLASLHRGEMILPRNEADLFRQGRLRDGGEEQAPGIFGPHESAAAERIVQDPFAPTDMQNIEPAVYVPLPSVPVLDPLQDTQQVPEARSAEGRQRGNTRGNPYEYAKPPRAAATRDHIRDITKMVHRWNSVPEAATRMIAAQKKRETDLLGTVRFGSFDVKPSGDHGETSEGGPPAVATGLRSSSLPPWTAAPYAASSMEAPSSDPDARPAVAVPEALNSMDDSFAADLPALFTEKSGTQSETAGSAGVEQGIDQAAAAFGLPKLLQPAQLLGSAPADLRSANVDTAYAPLSSGLNAEDKIGSALGTESMAQTVSFEGGDININIRVTGQVENMDPAMQRQMVESVQAQIAGAGLRELVSNGFTRRQNW